MIITQYKSYIFRLISLLIFGILLITPVAIHLVQAVISNGSNAANVLGQLDGSGNVTYTKRGPNNGPRSTGFDLARGIAIDTTNHRLFVSDLQNNRVLIFNLTSGDLLTDYTADNVLGQSDFLGMNSATTQSGMNGPEGLLLDSANSRLYVADSNNNRVLVFDVSTIVNGEAAINVLGQSNFTSSTAGTTQSVISRPYGLALDSENNRLFVMDNGNTRVLIFNVATISNGEDAVNVLGQSNFTNSAIGTTASRFFDPRGVAYSNSGSAQNRLFVADGGNSRVLIFDTTTLVDGEDAVNVLGQSDFTSNSSASPTRNGLFGPADVAVNGNTLYVADMSNHRVVTFGLAAITNGDPAAFVLGQSDFTSNTAGTSQTQMDSPNYLAFNPTANQLYVVEQQTSRILVFEVATITNGEAAVNMVGQSDLSGNPIYDRQGPNNGAFATGFNQPYGVAIDTTNHRLFVADFLNNRVLVFNLTAGDLLTDYTADFVLGQSDFISTGSGLSASRISRPRDLAFDATNNRLYVADSQNNRILVFNVSTISNGEDAVNVLGQSNFTSNSSGLTQNGLNLPVQLAYDAGPQNLYVADGSQGRVLVFNTSTLTNGQNATYVIGQSDFTTNNYDTTQSNMGVPSDIAIDSSGKRLFVIDNNRVMVFNLDSTTGNPTANFPSAAYVLGQSNFTANDTGTTQSTFNVPIGLAYDTTNQRLFVSERNNGRVMAFDVSAITNGENATHVLGKANFTATNGGAVTQSNLAAPRGIDYVVSTGQLFVADPNDNRVVVFDAAPPNTAPSVTVNSATAATDGTVSISVAVSDVDTNNTKLKVLYVARTGASCGDDETFSTKATLSQTAADITATVTPKPDVTNSNAYQIGTTTPILTSASNTVTFKWNAASDLVSPNAAYCLQFTANDGTVDGTAVSQSLFTPANVPGTPTVDGATVNSLDVTIAANSNPSGTQFSIQETSSLNYVQANGSLGASAAWQTVALWGGASGVSGKITVNTLTAGITYTFAVTARNGDSVSTSASGVAIGLTQGGGSRHSGGTEDQEDQEEQEKNPPVVVKPPVPVNPACLRMGTYRSLPQLRQLVQALKRETGRAATRQKVQVQLDFNGDGKFTMADLVTFIMCLRTPRSGL